MIIMESTMEQQHSGGIGSVGDAMSIFSQSLDVRRPTKSKRRVTRKKFSSGIEEPARSGLHSLHQRKAIAAKERARAELSRAMSMAKELERQIEQTDAKTRSHRSELQATRASSVRRTRGALADAAGAGQPHQESGSAVSSLYSEVMRELDRVKSELRKLQLEVKLAKEARAERNYGDASASRVSSSGSHVANGVERHAEDQEHGVLVKLGMFTDATNGGGSSPEATAMTTTRREGQKNTSLQEEAEAEMSSAKAKLESRTRKETARVADEIDRITEQEKKARAQVQQLNAKLLKARSQLDAVTAADENAEETLSNLTATLRRLEEDTAAAEKEKALTELESRCVRDDTESIDAVIAATEQRIRGSVRELEAARASEAAATEKLRAIVESATLARAAATAASSSQRSKNVMIPRFEYEYLTGRAEFVRTAADKKVAAADAWMEARRAGEKEMTMRAAAIEREIGEARAREADAVDGHDAARHEPRDGLPRARPSRSRASTTTSRRKPPSSAALPAAQKPRSPSSSIKKRKRRVPIPNCLKLIAGRCGGQN